jgi:hypothetical protein
MKRFLILAALFLIAISCNNKTDNNNQNQSVQPTRQQLNALDYPPVPDDLVQEIGTQGDHIDVIFYNMPISISRNGNADVQQMLSQVGDQAPGQVAPCNPIGRIFFQGQGETIAEADLYLGENCNYYLFMIENKPAYANVLLPQGVKFYENLLAPYRNQ